MNEPRASGPAGELVLFWQDEHGEGNDRFGPATLYDLSKADPRESRHKVGDNAQRDGVTIFGWKSRAEAMRLAKARGARFEVR